MKRVTGLGGVFFKSEEPKKLREWYGKHLGLDMEDWGSTFLWIDPNNPEAKAQARTAWSPFEKDTTYFNPSTKSYMFNYRVENLVELLKVLRDEGVTVIDKVEDLPYGKFGWIMDPEGNKIELWEPKDEGF
ncbi:MAG TPA: VOC family protein [Chryseolinea sp.]|nr:VOC family protein [Chryseolinea sp.]